MNTESITYELKPNWSRMLDRFYTLGLTQQYYSNGVATLSMEGEYPRLIPTAEEDKMFTLSGDHEWSLDSWKRGTLTVNHEYRTAEFRFSAANEENFHSVRLTPDSHWDCFECLLKLYAMEIIDTELNPMLSSASGQLNGHIARLARAVNRELIRGKKIFCSLPISGGSMLKDFELKSMMTQFGRVALRKNKVNHSNLLLKPKLTEYAEFSNNVGKFRATLYNSLAQPQLYLSVD